jgi:hypothetical protein
VTDLLKSYLENFDSDRVYSVVGAAAGLLEGSNGTASAALREELLGAVFNASLIQDPSTEAVNQQATLLNRLTTNANLSSTAVALALDMVEGMARVSEELGITGPTALALGSTISTLFSSVDMNDTSSVAALGSSVSLLAYAGTNDLSPGEAPFAVSTPGLNLSSQVGSLGWAWDTVVVGDDSHVQPLSRPSLGPMIFVLEADASSPHAPPVVLDPGAERGGPFRRIAVAAGHHFGHQPSRERPRGGL